MKFAKKPVAHILAGAVLALSAGQASAISVSSAPETFSGTITNGAGTVTIPGTLNNANGHILTASATQAAVYHDYTTVKSWADMAIDLGWMHNVDWVQVNVTTAGTYNIKSQVLGIRNVAGNANTATSTYSPLVADTSIHPAFSVWSLAGNTFTSSGSSNNPATNQSPLAYGYAGGTANNKMGFNQVAEPSATNNSAFLLAGGVNHIVGYSNSGHAGWYNGNGDYVTSGSTGASNGANADGYLWTDLTVDLAVGSYLIASGGSCVDLVDCGPYQTKTTIATGATSIAWGTGWYELSVTAVPVPGAVWLFGTAMAGMIGFGRRKQA